MADTPTRSDPRADSELSALSFARRVHLGQHRKQTHEPFVEHPIAVARLLTDAGFEGTVITAAYLHDVVEKTPVSLEEIAERFGSDVAEIVDALTEDAALDGYGPRKRALRTKALASNRAAVLIYAADRVANMRDWSRVEAGERAAIADRLDTSLPERLELWTEDLQELTAYDDGLPFLAEIELELRALVADASAA
jgi:GTP diphosphokinase / guanosine-3',5'-bis(diphosphate) 3'-diphosphatase